jgi:RNA polymerase primary sigma factor/RNA polymerase sigma factor
MASHYKIQPIKELRDQQVRYAPREKKIEQLERAEKFYREIVSVPGNTAKNYSYKSICFLITEYRPEMYADLLFPGEEVKSDLLQFIDDLANSIAIPLEQVNEPTWTTAQLCEKFNVSSKTISRWRKIGLISRRFLVDGKKRVGFLNSSVEHFIAWCPELVRRGKHFSQLTEEERTAIIQQAKKISQKGKTPTEVARLLSEKTGRGVETIRSMLKVFDEANPETAIFPNRNSPLPEEVRLKIYQSFRKGETIEKLAEQYKRTKASIYNIIGVYRVRRIKELPLDYIDSPEFHTTETRQKETLFTGPMPSGKRQQNSKTTPFPIGNLEEDIVGSEVFVAAENQNDSTGQPPYLAGLYAIPLLTPEQERHLFRKMNYLKYKANKLRATLNEEKPKIHLMTQIEQFYDQAVQTKHEIIAANLRLAASIARKHVSPVADFYELMSDGNLVLMKAVEKFDYSRGNKFSTYATWAIMKHFARLIPLEKKHRGRFHSSEEKIIESTEDFHTSQTYEENIQAERESLVQHLMSELSDREQQILAERFGVADNDLPKTLRQIGIDMHVTQEWVRQIEIRALSKLQRLAKTEQLEMP